MSVPCMTGSSHKKYPQKATTGCAEISESKIPKWMSLLFRPSSTMTLSDTEVVIAAYIFMVDNILSSKEILVISLDGLAIGDMQTLLTLRPTSYVCTEVIMMVVCLLTHYKNMPCDYASCWFLPPQFSERVLNEKNTTADISKDYRNPFMGFVDKIKKIFIPIYDEGLHWYLVVIDLVDNKLWLLDSNPFP
ncbi:Ulp1 protease family, C-terminal catalytic domain [Sesbania bispinosa]|nr:Ulp1 protease family, C-terminal catalytic domain [Sesbania bispinosa]